MRKAFNAWNPARDLTQKPIHSENPLTLSAVSAQPAQPSNEAGSWTRLLMTGSYDSGLHEAASQMALRAIELGYGSLLIGSPQGHRLVLAEVLAEKGPCIENLMDKQAHETSGWVCGGWATLKIGSVVSSEFLSMTTSELSGVCADAEELGPETIARFIDQKGLLVSNWGPAIDFKPEAQSSNWPSVKAQLRVLMESFSHMIHPVFISLSLENIEIGQQEEIEELLFAVRDRAPKGSRICTTIYAGHEILGAHEHDCLLGKRGWFDAIFLMKQRVSVAPIHYWLDQIPTGLRTPLKAIVTHKRWQHPCNPAMQGGHVNSDRLGYWFDARGLSPLMNMPMSRRGEQNGAEAKRALDGSVESLCATGKSDTDKIRSLIARRVDLWQMKAEFEQALLWKSLGSEESSLVKNETDEQNEQEPPRRRGKGRL